VIIPFGKIEWKIEACAVCEAVLKIKYKIIKKSGAKISHSSKF
jgi:hypothetical protein